LFCDEDEFPQGLDEVFFGIEFIAEKGDRSVVDAKGVIVVEEKQQQANDVLSSFDTVLKDSFVYDPLN
jgi:hypothetical protein